MLNADEVRKDFPILNRMIHERKLVYFDNAASTLKPIQVIEAIKNFYVNHYANVHRGFHTLSQEASQMYEQAHETLAKFINAYSWDEIVFVNNTTEGLNLVAYSWGLHNINEGDEIVLTVMDHHSSMLPWRHIAKIKKARIKYINVTNDGYLNYDQLDEVINEKTKVVAFPIASNVLGTINDVRKIVKKAREVGALVVADGAQSVPHMPTDVRELGVDFLAFSGHKMLGPTGSGVLWGRRDLLQELKPFKVGGDTIKDVTLDDVIWLNPPWKFEAGTPNIEAAIGLAVAAEYLMKIGMENVRRHEIELVEYMLKMMLETFGDEIIYYGPKNTHHKTGVVAFNVKNLHFHIVAQALDYFGIAVRSGMHCAHPLHYALRISHEYPPPQSVPDEVDERLKRFGSVRASFYIYNTKEEIDYFIGSLSMIILLREQLKTKPVEAVCTGT
ncbi:SufS family cysteine desulfurase [Ignisphaera sp. 4213-co]|uniref:Cysteine desulfurase n=1 Tax=Ignisphaera cupida TaxID=3050454 RepID=A0ABD4Z658_9CREN|nr:SufS family cysteine desulfurase [Ignisphaera sp. 4213-co]MDK6028599.1 SufS family cysteine desulfurase [Ignisphaera sp. 4213-co]